ncbi:hypothetical protein QBC43DRAFT_334300 [Cladorrhinum sp. PSN259]|nr:hypothetical protein QBC43DRAFT_334300 [Cladorrhinum sp. PSN259]
MMHHYYLYLNRKLKDAHLIHLCNEAQRTGQTTAIFTRSLSETRRVSRLLHSLKMGIVSLQSNLSRSARAAALDKLRRKECHAIVTTDVAATLDPIRVPVVDRIINFSLTWKMTAGTYMQRISNVDGAGSSWHGAITFVTQ